MKEVWIRQSLCRRRDGIAIESGFDEWNSRVGVNCVEQNGLAIDEASATGTRATGLSHVYSIWDASAI